jgi:DNA-directed RNA polymerase subunit RPC12/RpoP
MKGVSKMGKYIKPASELKLSTVRPPLYRYYCDACSGDAFFSDKREAMKRVECQHCGKDFTTKLENYLPNRT